MPSTRKLVAGACRASGITTAAETFDPASVEKGARLVYRHEGVRALKAGGRAYAKRDQWSVALYSKRRAEDAEEAVEAAFAEAGILIGDSSSGFDDDHGLHWTEWDFELAR